LLQVSLTRFKKDILNGRYGSQADSRADQLCAKQDTGCYSI